MQDAVGPGQNPPGFPPDAPGFRPDMPGLSGTPNTPPTEGPYAPDGRPVPAPAPFGAGAPVSSFPTGSIPHPGAAQQMSVQGGGQVPPYQPQPQNHQQPQTHPQPQSHPQHQHQQPPPAPQRTGHQVPGVQPPVPEQPLPPGQPGHPQQPAGVPHTPGPGPQGPVPQGPAPQGPAPQGPVPQGPAPHATGNPAHAVGGHPAPAEQHTAAPAHPAAGRPSESSSTGHIRLPTGAPVAAPHPPQHAEAADPGATTLAVLLIGPAGAGKTSVARHWADRRRVPTAHISLDDVREWVRCGFADPQSGWNDNSEAQYRLARRTCGFAARNFLANNISCIIDDAVFPDRPVIGLGGWKRHVGPGLLPVVLLPGLEIVLERNSRRSGNRRLSDEEVARIHGRMAGWYGSGLPIIDNSQLDVAGTAAALDEVLSRAISSPPQW